MPWALYFDGIDDYVHIPRKISADLGNCRYAVVQGYFKDMNPGVISTILSLTISGNTEKLVVQTHTVSSADASRYGAGARSQASDTYQNKAVSYLSRLPPFQEHFIRVKIDIENNDVLFWADGQPLAMSGTVSWPRTTFTAQVGNDTCYIGRRPSSPPSYFRGYIRGLEIWGEDTLIVRYPTNEGTGSVLTDTSGNGYHGTIHGATWVWVDEPAPGQPVIGSITFRGRSFMSLAGIKHATGSITFRGGSFMSLIGLVLRELEGVYQISSSEIISRNQPVLSTDLANYIEVWINPMVPAATAEEIYRSKEAEAIPPGETKTFTVEFDEEPVIEATATLEEAGPNLSIITNETKYFGSTAEIAVYNSGTTEQTCIIVVNGKPLEVQGRRKIVVKDEESILDHGLVKYEFDSPLVQDEASARDIGQKILRLFSVARANIEIKWRGDPALELADICQIPEFEKLGVTKKENFYITRQQFVIEDGGLNVSMAGRKVPKAEE